MLTIKVKMALLIAFAASLWGCSADNKNSQVLDWVMQQDIKDRKVYHLQLPANLAAEAVDKQVEVGKVNKQYFILIKKSIGRKDNFEGIVISNKKIPEPKTSINYPNISYLSIPGLDFSEELYVSKRINPTTLKIYFDLN